MGINLDDGKCIHSFNYPLIQNMKQPVITECLPAPSRGSLHKPEAAVTPVSVAIGPFRLFECFV